MRPYVKLMGKIVTPVWSGNKLSEKYNRFKDHKIIGECWETSVEVDSQPSIIGESAFSFSDYVNECGLKKPPLVKIIDAKMPLSVQVHPDKATAEKYGDTSKHEFWYVLHAEPNAHILYGTEAGITREAIIAQIENGDILSSLCSIPVSTGDTFMIPEGMIHSLGAGVTVLEVQNRLGTTYRIKDIADNREVHIKESAECIRLYDHKTAQSFAATNHARSESDLPGDVLVSTSEYTMTRFCAENALESLRIDGRGIYMFCECGCGTICNDSFGSGDSFFMGDSGCEITLKEGSSVLFVK